MNYTWKIIKLGEIETVWQNAIQKQSIVLEEVTDKDYKGGIVFDLIKDKVSLYKDLKVWDTIEVSLNFRVTEYKEKNYNNVTAWKITKQSEWHAFPEDLADDLPF